MKRCPLTITLLLALLILPFSASAAISIGLLSDFEDGTLQGWSGLSSPLNIPGGGPVGTTDNFLQIGGEFAVRFATYNASPEYSGPVDPLVTAFQVDLMRPATDPDALEIRLVLFGGSLLTNDRWTSSDPSTIPNDGIWRPYTFSLLESDLTQVQGTESYTSMITTVNRIMWRHDPDPASPTGIQAPGTLGIDNVAAVPEPGPSLFLLIAATITTLAPRRRRRYPR
jgi:hypothetical protein